MQEKTKDLLREDCTSHVLDDADAQASAGIQVFRCRLGETLPEGITYDSRTRLLAEGRIGA